MKKFTVIGTIGQTQGMTSANRPPIAEAIKKGISPACAFWAISLWTTAAGAGELPSRSEVEAEEALGASVAAAPAVRLAVDAVVFSSAGAAARDVFTGVDGGWAESPADCSGFATAAAAGEAVLLPWTMVRTASGSVHCPGLLHVEALQIMYRAWQRSVRAPAARRLEP